MMHRPRALAAVCLGLFLLAVRVTSGQTPAVTYYDASSAQAVDFNDPAKLRAEYDEQFLLTSLEGLVNRDARQLFVRYLPPFDDFWWARMHDSGAWLAGVSVEAVTSRSALLAKFASYYQGAVVYDESVPATSDVAAAIAGADNLLVLRYDTSPTSLYQQLTTGAGALPVKVRLLNADGTPLFTGAGNIPGTTLLSSGSAKNDAYRWLIENYLKPGKLDPTQLGYYLDAFWLRANPGYPQFGTNLPNIDYIIAHRGIVFDLDVFDDETPVDDPAQAQGTDLATLKQLLAACYQLTHGNTIIDLHGFVPWAYKYTTAQSSTWSAGGKHDPVPAEWTSVQLFTSYNVASDCDAMTDMANASFFQHYPLPAVVAAPPPLLTKQNLIDRGLLSSTGALLPTNYYAFYVGDYDSAAWLYQYMPGIWSDPARGSTPLSWGINPNLADRFAFGMAWMRKTATANDSFIAGDDGAGYINPGLLSAPRTSGLPSGVFPWNQRNTARFKQWGLDAVGFIIDGYSPFMTSETLDAYANFAPLGLVTQYTPPETVHNGMPLLPIASIGVNSASEMINLFGSGGPHFVVGRTILWTPTMYSQAVQGIDSGTTLPHKLVDLRTLLQLYKYAASGQIGGGVTQTYSQWAASHFAHTLALVPNGSFENNPVGTKDSSPPDSVDSGAFGGFRFFDIISGTVKLTATIKSGGSAGGQMLNLKVTNGLNGNSPAPFGAYGFDFITSCYQATSYGSPDQLTFDAESAGSTAATLGVDIAEYDFSNNYLGNQYTQVVSVPRPLGGNALGAAAGFSHYVIPFVPAHPETATVDVVFGPGTATAGTTEVNIDNVQYGSIARSAPAATPFGDGVTNLLKYALHINPEQAMTAADLATLPASGIDSTTTPGAPYLTLTYRKNAAAVGLSWTLQKSTDFQSWTAVVPDITTTVSVDPTTGDPTIRVGVKISGATREYLRLQVTQS